MSDYSVTTDFSVKDGLSTGDPEKIISGADVDTEFDNIATHMATKYDSNDLASEIEAEGLLLNTKLLTPLRLDNVFKDKGAILSDLQALTAPAADRIYGYDLSGAASIAFTPTNGIQTSGTNLQFDDATVAGTGIACASGVVSISHLGLESLTDPGADRLMMWDESANALKFAVISTGLTVSGTNILVDEGNVVHDNLSGFVANEHINHSSVSVITASRGLSASNNDLTSNIGLELDITSCTNIEADSLAAANEFVVDQSGVPKAIQYQKMGMRVQTAQTTQTLAAGDANTIMEFNGTATITVPADATHTWPPGAGILICNDHATQDITVTVTSTAVLNSIYHPGGATTVSDKVIAGGSAALVYLGSDQWYLSGDTKDA